MDRPLVTDQPIPGLDGVHVPPLIDRTMRILDARPDVLSLPAERSADSERF